MSAEYVLTVARGAIMATLYLAAPLLAISLLVGLTISVFQATTQIQEQTLTFVPKILAVLLGLLLFGGWMLTTIVNYTANLFAQLGTYGM
ncbi:MAG TPA: flagellar biosynthesis protein FliQ [Firmicutes bacterium]|nr:flagellar biosynthesis protein FliQ [Bacillota bacterium]